MTEVAEDVFSFDAKASACRIIAKAKSIQDLLKHYEQNTRQLQEDVAQHILKEVAENNHFKLLETMVAESQLKFLQNNNYVRYVHQMKEADVPYENTFPTSRMRTVGVLEKSEEDLRTLPWLLRLRSSEFSKWCPDAAVSLKAYGDVREVFLGWRGRSESSTLQFDDMCDYVFDLAQRHSTDALSPTEPYACFFSGVLFTPSSIVETGKIEGTLKQIVSVASSLQHRFTSRPRVLAIAQAYTDCVLDMSSLTREAFKKVLWSEVSYIQDENSLSVTKSGEVHRLHNNFLPTLQCDTQDNVALVQPSRLHGCQVFRGFFIGARLVAIEHVGVPVDVFSLMQSGNDVGTVRSIDSADDISQIAQCFCSLFFCCAESDCITQGNMAITISLRYEPLLHSSQGDALRHTGVVLDVSYLTPSLPFYWHLTWPEVCALGQLCHAKRTAADSSNDGDIVFKATRVPVAFLSSCDKLSTLLFPPLNQQIMNCGDINRRDDFPRDTNCIPRSMQHFPFSALSSGAILGATLAFFAMSSVYASWRKE